MVDKAGRTRRKATQRRALAIARTREDILMAAASVLARGRSHAVSLQDIAAEVGFTAPALYAYFDSKEAIFAELLRLLGRELAGTFTPDPPASGSFRERVGLLVRRQLEWIDRRREVFVAFLTLRSRGESGLFPARAGQQLCTGPEDYLRRLADWLRAASGRGGALGDHDPGEAAGVLMGIAHGYFLRWVTGAAHQEHLADQTEAILDFFFHGLGGPTRATLPRPARSARR